jgi:hypothetical protein
LLSALGAEGALKTTNFTTMANEDNRRNISVDESRTSSKLPPLQIALLLPDSTRFQTDFERKYSKGNLTDRISARIPQKFSIKQFD